MAEIEKLVVQLSADIKKYENALNRAQGVTQKRAQAIEGRFAKMNRNIGTSIAGFGKAGLAGIAGAMTLKGFTSLSDAAIRVDNALKVAGLSGEELNSTYAKLRDSAMRNAAPIEALVTLYGRVALVQDQLGISSNELIGFTDTIGLALRVAGSDASAASGALLQLSQALGGGVVRAEEFNSIVEGAPTIMQAAAAGIKEAGGSVAKLRQIMLDGELSSRALFEGIRAGSSMLEEKVATSQFTVANALTNVKNALVDAAREFNDSTGAANSFAGGLNNVAKAIADVDVSGLIEKISNARQALQNFLASAGNAEAFNTLNKALGLLDENGKPVNLDIAPAKAEATALEKEVKTLQATIANNTELGFDNTEALAQLDQVSARLAQVKAQIANMPATVPAVSAEAARTVINSQVPFNPLPPISTPERQISYKDYPATGGKTKSGGGGKGGGKGKKGGAGRENEYQREIEQIKERTAAIQAETAALAGVNPLIDDYDFAITKARASHDLLTAAQQAGIAVTPELKAKIDQLATGYANATVEANKQAEAQDRLRDAADDLRDLGKDVLGGFISDLRNGKSAAEALEGALNKIADKLLDMTLESLFSGGGWLAKLFGLKDGGAVKLAGGGRVSGPGGTRGDKIPALLSDQEHVVNAKAARKYRPLLDGMNAGMPLKLANGGAVGVSAPRLAKMPVKQATRGPQPVALTVRVDGATGNEEVKRMVAQGVSQGIGQYDKQVDRTFGARMAKAQMRQL